jgi:hypothetical protein
MPLRLCLRCLLPLGVVVSSLWLLWPLLRPLRSPASGQTLVAVFDGYHRLDAALHRTPPRWPLLLLTCPRFQQPTPEQIRQARQQQRPFWVVPRGHDSAHHLAVLSGWLRHPPPSLPPVQRVLLVSDAHHLHRLLPAARLALGGLGLGVAGLIADSDQPPAQRPPLPGPWLISRYWRRLQLWRASGSTGVLRPRLRRHKQAVCG